MTILSANFIKSDDINVHEVKDFEPIVEGILNIFEWCKLDEKFFTGIDVLLKNGFEELTLKEFKKHFNIKSIKNNTNIFGGLIYGKQQRFDDFIPAIYYEVKQ